MIYIQMQFIVTSMPGRRSAESVEREREEEENKIEDRCDLLIMGLHRYWMIFENKQEDPDAAKQSQDTYCNIKEILYIFVINNQMCCLRSLIEEKLKNHIEDESELERFSIFAGGVLGTIFDTIRMEQQKKTRFGPMPKRKKDIPPTHDSHHNHNVREGVDYSKFDTLSISLYNYWCSLWEGKIESIAGNYNSIQQILETRRDNNNVDIQKILEEINAINNLQNHPSIIFDENAEYIITNVINQIMNKLGMQFSKNT
jgi:hypothetical protein